MGFSALALYEQVRNLWEVNAKTLLRTTEEHCSSMPFPTFGTSRTVLIDRFGTSIKIKQFYVWFLIWDEA